jgi:hypothetical protein
MGIKCPVCSKECKDKRGLGLHIGAAHVDMILEGKKFSVNDPDQMIEPVYPGSFSQVSSSGSTNQINMINDALVDMQRQIFQIARQNRVNPNNLGMQQAQPMPVYQDQFDHELSRMMKIMQIGQLNKMMSSHGLHDTLALMKFIDDREIPEEEPNDIVAALQHLGLNFPGVNPPGQKKNSPEMRNMTIGNNPPSPPAQPPQPPSSLPNEKALLDMSDERIVDMINDHPAFGQLKQAIKNKFITKQGTFNQIKQVYPNFPDSRMENIWNRITKTEKKA